MYHQSIHPLFLLLALLNLSLHSFAINLGIQKDAFETRDKIPIEIESYTGRITFNEDTMNSVGQYPPQFMSDEKMLKLLVLAYKEMVALHQRSLLASSQRPRAMIALAVGKEIFFASSMKGDWKVYYGGQTSNKRVKEVLANCQTTSELTHRTQLACGEPNVLDLSLSAKEVDFDPPTRITAWVTWTVLGQEANRKPCSGTFSRYGCQAIIDAFELIAFWNKTPDPADGSEWTNQYTIGANPRAVCAVP